MPYGGFSSLGAFQCFKEAGRHDGLISLFSPLMTVSSSLPHAVSTIAFWSSRSCHLRSPNQWDRLILNLSLQKHEPDKSFVIVLITSGIYYGNKKKIALQILP